MAKHFDLDDCDDRFTFARKTEAIAAEAALDGIYIVRTSLPRPPRRRRHRRRVPSLAQVERAFRSLKTVDLRSGRCITGSAPASAPTYSCACWL